MMVDPEWYYEENLKGKTADQIGAVVRSLKRKCHHLMKVVANPKDYQQEWMICPEPEVQLAMYRLYLQKALEVLQDAEKAEEASYAKLRPKY